MRASEQLAYLLYAALVASAFEGCVKVLVDDGEGCVDIDEASGDRDAVAVVVLSSEVSYLGCPAEGAAHVAVLIHRHLDAVAAAADDDAAAVGAFFEGAAHLMCEIGVVAAVGAVGAEILHLETAAAEVIDDFKLEIVASMVACYRNNFVHEERCL